MRVLKLDKQEGVVRLQPQVLEDLWFLKKFLQSGDLVEGRSFRRFKADKGKEGARAKSGEKKPVSVEVEVESVEYAEDANKLRVSGKITKGFPEEFVQVGEHHTIDVEPRGKITVCKSLTALDLALLSEVKKRARHVTALVVALDERKATVSALRTMGVKVLFEASNPASKRDVASFESKKGEFYESLANQLEQSEADAVILAGPGFAKEDFKKFLEEKHGALSKKIRLEHASTAEQSAVAELMKRGAIARLLGEGKLQEEFEALEKLKASVGKEDGLSCYGLKDVKDALERGAVKQLFVLDELVRKSKDAGRLMELAAKANAEIMVFNSEDDAGREFQAFKIAAILHYKAF
ncbi:MAG: mRNA surveillance protein pelota [Candidatus Micrarchaeia archaeon]